MMKSISAFFFISFLLLFQFTGIHFEIKDGIKTDPSFQQAKELRILFVGNSLTYYNNLPGLVQERGKEKGIKITTEILAKPNYALVDHWNDGLIQTKIQKGDFDYVVVQQGPSSQAEGRALLLSYGKEIAKICETSKAQLAFFMVWPSRQYYHTFDGVIRNYREAALENGAVLCPVGEAWKSHFDETANFDYYGPDGFHPSLKGSQVAADIIVSSLLN
ncbi:SGNH/GDSL hydrolase family protein [Lutimonas vermicola]|uniref:SGNH/GDSL hydrolase family protein n=1 Tax=Lutimonas vermicola TaxID=414288 RepID=A0ABU9L3R6_9FLAO